MNALRYALAGFLLVTAVFGQSSKLRQFGRLYAYKETPFEQFSTEVVILPKVYAEANADRYERLNRDLEKIFTSRKRVSFSVTSDEADRSSFRHSLEDSPIVEFAMMGAQDIKKLKGGFTIKNPFGGPDIDAYLKSGIAWHPTYDKYLTYTIGRRVSRAYAFRDERDIFNSHVKVPIERFNARMERVAEKLLDGIGF